MTKVLNILSAAILSLGALATLAEAQVTKDNLDQNENGVKQNCCLAHFNAPDTCHGIRNGANRGYAQVGFD